MAIFPTIDVLFPKTVVSLATSVRVSDVRMWLLPITDTCYTEWMPSWCDALSLQQRWKGQLRGTEVVRGNGLHQSVQQWYVHWQKYRQEKGNLSIGGERSNRLWKYVISDAQTFMHLLTSRPSSLQGHVVFDSHSNLFLQSPHADYASHACVYLHILQFVCDDVCFQLAQYSHISLRPVL
jgi:hypothetical protein